MRSRPWIVFALLVAPAYVQGADCPITGNAIAPHVERARIERALSANAELVASSGSGRSRAVGKPSGPRRALPVVNFIDTHIGAKMSRDGVQPTDVAGDEEFLRRVHLDLTGTIPTPADVTAFVADAAPDKRARKIDALLRSPAFTDRWTMWFGDLVQNVQFASNGAALGSIGRNAYYTWIYESIRDGKPYDAMVRELLAAEGRSFIDGATNYIVRQMQKNGPPQDTLDNLATHSFEKFMGMPVLCISCHTGAFHLELVNWYLRGKTRQDFWKTAAFFSRTTLQTVRFRDPEVPQLVAFQEVIGSDPNGVYRLNTTDGNKSPRQPGPGQSDVVTPAFLTTGEQPREGESYRVAFGRMLTAERQFARAAVNHLWKEMFGLGLVEPVHSFDLAKLKQQTPHPELLEALTDELIARNFSLREVLRTIALSSTYQLSARYTPGAWNESWTSHYARRYPRRMHAEVLFDAIVTATGVPDDVFVDRLGPRATTMQLPDSFAGNRFLPYFPFLDLFGRGNRDDVPRSNESTILQAMALLNGNVLLQRTRQSTRGSTVERVLASTSDPGAVADQLYMATLSRKPAPEERSIAVEYLQGGPLAERTEDLQYVLLNTLEFLFQ